MLESVIAKSVTLATEVQLSHPEEKTGSEEKTS
jgi:hypothetical protein